MVLKTRIIPCLDIDNGMVVKGVKFQNLKKIDTPIALARYYAESGADELCFLDITASSGKRDIILSVVKEVANECDIPFSVGGGIRTLHDAKLLIESGADKVVIGTAAVSNPMLIQEIANIYGSQAVISSIDALKVKSGVFEETNGDKAGYNVFTYGGRKDTGIDVLVFARAVVEMGVGEILLNSIDSDGEKKGFDHYLNSAITKTVNVPVIASGGAGDYHHFADVVKECNVSAVLAASIFHSKQVLISDVKKDMQSKGVNVRMTK